MTTSNVTPDWRSEPRKVSLVNHRRANVARLADAGVRPNAIADLLDVDRRTIYRDLKALAAELAEERLALLMLVTQRIRNLLASQDPVHQAAGIDRANKTFHLPELVTQLAIDGATPLHTEAERRVRQAAGAGVLNQKNQLVVQGVLLNIDGQKPADVAEFTTQRLPAAFEELDAGQPE